LAFILLFFALTAAVTASAEVEKVQNPGRANRVAEIRSEIKTAETNGLEEVERPIFWGFGNYGFSSGYMLYGSLVNPDPTLQGYVEANVNLPWSLGPLSNLGYFGGGVWSNSDLTRRRSDLRGAFNEWDFNIHWGKMFWFDDAKTWGLTFRTWVVWYYYPPRGGDWPDIKTTFDWDYSFELVNPYVVPFVTIVHEYVCHGTLFEFGLKRPFMFFDNRLSVVPQLVFVGRDSHYGWCFPNYGKFPEDGCDIPAGLATGKLELDMTYMFNKYFGVFAKAAVCMTLQDDLRDAVDNRWPDSYGYAKDFAWGSIGLCFNF